MPPALVIVSGPPATGKTTIANKIAESFGLPFVYKDAIKEKLFDVLGWKDRDWSRRIGAAAYELLFYFVETELAAGRSLVVESNFRRDESTPHFRRIQAKHDFIPVQIMCWAEGETLVARFRDRDSSGNRHPGHVDSTAIKDVDSELLVGRYDPLDLSGEVVEVETTHFDAIDFGNLVERIGSLLEIADPTSVTS